MVFLVEHSKIMLKGGIVEWIWKLFTESGGARQQLPSTQQLPEYLQRLLRRTTETGLVSGAACWDMVDWSLKENLEADQVINWCSKTGVLYPIKSDGRTPSDQVGHDSWASHCEDLNASIEFLNQIITTLEEENILTSNFLAKESTIIALSNLIGQPIVLYCQSELTPTGMAGIYLPTRGTQRKANRTPLVLVYCVGERYVPLLHLEPTNYALNDSSASKRVTTTVPLVHRNLKFLTIKTAESETLENYDVLLDYLEISVKRDSLSGLYFFGAATDCVTVELRRQNGAKNFSNISSVELRHKNVAQISTLAAAEESRQQTCAKNSNFANVELRHQNGAQNSNLEDAELRHQNGAQNYNLAAGDSHDENGVRNSKIVSQITEIITPNSFSVSTTTQNENNGLPSRVPIDNPIYLDNLSNLKRQNFQFLRTNTSLDELSLQRRSEMVDGITYQTRVQPRSMPADPRPDRPANGFRITEINAEKSPNSKFQHCLALGCDNFVVDRKTFPLCSECNEKLFIIGTERKQIADEWSIETNALLRMHAATNSIWKSGLLLDHKKSSTYHLTSRSKTIEDQIQKLEIANSGTNNLGVQTGRQNEQLKDENQILFNIPCV